jgi:hypothetical protein
MTSKYLLSFSAASLCVNEMEIIANLFMEFGDWERVEKEVIEKNALQKGAISTRKREFIELKKRVTILNEDEFSLYEDATGSELKYLAMLGCFKMYKIIYDFATEVMVRKLLLFDFKILNSDYESFYESKSVTYENLNSISESTRYKLKQVMFKIFEQAELIDNVKNKNIQKPYLSERLIKAIVQDNPKYLRAFLYSNNEINEYKKRYL